MASHRLNPRYAIKECSTCGRLYTKECCSIGSLDDKILVPEPDSSILLRFGKMWERPYNGSSFVGCAFLRKKISNEDLLALSVENGLYKTFQDTPNHPNDNTKRWVIKDFEERRLMKNERDCEIRIRKLKQDFNEWGSKVRKKEQAYEEEKYFAACRYMLSVTCNDEDDLYSFRRYYYSKFYV
ncbi:hypothetical protein Tco_1313532 [Tanacetum coccineum]